jgi:hypothetical protein
MAIGNSIGGKNSSWKNSRTLQSALDDVNEKTIHRAIASGKLAAKRPHPNRAEIVMSDLEAWHSSRLVRPGETQD